MNLSVEEKKLLLSIARKSIESRFDKTVKLPEVDFEKFPILKSKGGAFVTLTMFDELRGCIGYIISETCLPEIVAEAAKQAAFADPRFPPLNEGELPQVVIEISILSEPFPMQSYDEIELGIHGLIIEEAGRRGLLLPQVPVEHNMNKEQFLDAICKKAGLPPLLWRTKKVNMQLFTATVFNEKELETGNGKN